MKLQYINLILLSTTVVSCGNTPGSTPLSSSNRSIVEKSACDITKNNYDVDSCLKIACDDAGGNLTDRGCECDSSSVFVYNEVPKCLEFDKSITTKRGINLEHEYISYTAFDSESLYSTDVINYDIFNAQEDYQFANYIAPNFLTINHLEDGSIIDSKFVDYVTKVPYIHVFQTFGDISPIEEVRFNTEMELSETAKHFELISKIEQTPFVSDEDYFFTKEGCLGLCEKVMNFYSPELEVKRIRKYFKGILSSDKVQIKNLGENLVSYQYDLISRTILKRNESSVDSRAISYELSSFSKNSTGIKSNNLINQEEDLNISYAKNSSWGNVVLCDNGLKPEQARTYKYAKLVRGPKNNSAYGWLTEVKDQSDYFNGALNLNSLGTGESGVSNHGFSVFSFMKEVNVASISLNSCLNDFSNWAPNAFESNFKVVNYSYYDSLDSKSCLSNHVWNEVKNNEIANKMLWVFAAGNDKSFLTKKNSMHCPQNIASGLENALVVGSDPEFGGVTNKGKDFVDFFVLAPSTSTAAAVASSLAANIAKKYPKLSAFEIKRAMLASVEYDRLPSRTGGILDEEKSFEAAKLINKDSRISNKRLLRKLHWAYINSNWLRRFE